MKQILPAAAMALVVCAAQAQTYHDSGGTVVPGFVPITPGVGPLFTPSNPGNVAGTFSASLSGFTPTPSYKQLTSSGTSSVSTAVPTGTVDVVYNTSASVAYCTYGASGVAATSSSDVIQANSWVAFTVPSGASTIACISPSGNLSINVSGGSGLPTGSGGGGGGGGGGSGNITQLNGNTIATGSGASNSGTLRAVLSSDTAGASPTNPSYANSMISGVAVNAGTGPSATGTARVATSTDSPGGALANPAFNSILQYQATPATQTISATDSGATCATTNNQGSQLICAGVPTSGAAATFIFPNALNGLGFSITGMTATVGGGYLESECSMDAGQVAAASAHWFVCSAHIPSQAAGNNPYQSQFTGNAVGATVNVAGLEGWRLRSTGTVSGTATVTVTQSSATNVTEVKGISSSGATGVAVPTEAMLAGMSVGGTHTAVPGTAYGVDIDTSSSSNLAALLSNGYGTFGQSYPLAGSATGAKGSGAINPLIQADTSYNINISTNTAGTAIQAGVTNQKIYVTGWEFMAAGTTTFVLFYSTSSGCGSSAGIISGPWSLSASNPGETFGGGLGSVAIVPTGDTLCFSSNGTSVAVGGHVSLTQF